MKTFQKMAQKILKYRTSVSMIFCDKMIIQEWLLFGTFRIWKTSKSI